MVESDDERATISDGGPSLDHDPEGALIGTDVGGYIVEGELGRGGMGVVYAATHPMIGKRVAIKVIKHSLSNSPATVERFVQEARSVNQIGHPNIVDIFAFGALPDGRSYLIMDLLVGESLRKRVKRGPLPVEDCIRILDEIASALAAAHDKGFIHRDLKPDNVFMHEQGGESDVKLLDFGLAKLLPNALTSRAFRTATGAMLGTPDYMSPEQLRGSGVDHRTDIYALGVVAFEVLAGDRPRRYSDGSFELDGLSVARHLVDVHGAPPALAELVDAMLSPAADQRPSLAAVRTVLKRVKNGATDAVRAIGTAPSFGTFEASTTPIGRPLQQSGIPPSASRPAMSPSAMSPSAISPSAMPPSAMSPSKVGARPLVNTPLSGSPTVVDGPPPQQSLPPPYSQPPQSQYSQPPYSQLEYVQHSQPPAHSQPPRSAPQPWSQQPQQAQPPPQQQPRSQPFAHQSQPFQHAQQSAPFAPQSQPAQPFSQQPRQSQPLPRQATVRPTPSYPPQYAGLAKTPSIHPATKLGAAPAPTRPSMPHPVAAARRGESRLWLFVGLGLVVASAIALVVVLAS